MKYVVSVSKTYIHRGKHNHRKNTKKRWHVYYYDEEGNFRTQRVNCLQALYYKTQKRKRLKYLCTECGNLFVGLVKSSKDDLDCPYCDEDNYG